MSVKLNLIAAACENMGIGKNNDLPWRLRSEMTYFTEMTKNTVDATKKNVVIMGRRTWDSIPPKFKPLSNRINFILSRSNLDVRNYEDSYAYKSLNEIINALRDGKFQYENVWVIGGSHIYKECMDSEHFHRLYMTKILKNFDCDTFFPKFDESALKEVCDPVVPTTMQSENGIDFIYKIYENPKFRE